MKAIRIALLVHGFHAGGIERSVSRLVNYIDQDRFAPLIVCLERAGEAVQWLERPVEIVEIKKRSGNDVSAMMRLARCLRERKVEIVQSHNWGTLIETVLARKLSGTPVHIHAERGTVLGMVEPGGGRHWMRARAMRLALSQVDEVVSNSRTVAARVEQRCGFPADRIRIIPNGVPPLKTSDWEERRRRTRKRLNAEHHTVILGSVGRMAPVKGFDIALRAFKKVLEKHADCLMLMVGDGPQFASLIDLAVELGLEDQVRFLGRQDDVRDSLSAMDIFFNSSHSEGMSQSMIEAMAVGLPVVGTDVGDAHDVIGQGQDAAGICVQSGCVDLFADALGQLVKDPLRRSIGGQHAYARYCDRYSEQLMVSRFETLYDDVLTKRPSRRLNLKSTV